MPRPRADLAWTAAQPDSPGRSGHGRSAQGTPACSPARSRYRAERA